MASIFNSLHIGYSGLNTAQVGIDTTSHNIANAESDGYNRQRVITAAVKPLNGLIGNGAEVVALERVFDNFVFDRFTSIASDKEYSDYEKKTLDNLSTYFPEIDGVGVKADLHAYYDMWQTLADNPDNDSIKLALSQQTETLANHIKETQSQVLSLQNQVNEELAVNVAEVNLLAAELAELNRTIDVSESGGMFSANDLRDKRNAIERDLAKLIGSTTNQGLITSNIKIDSSSNQKTGTYSVSVAGFNLVDGSNYHPIHMSQKENPNGFYDLSYKRQDGLLIPLGESLNGGRIGAILDMRGSDIDQKTGEPTNGIIQNAVSQLNALAKGLIETTNNVYAQTPTTRMESNILDIVPSNSIFTSDLNVNEGSFEIIIYDVDGEPVSTRQIDINITTVMTGLPNSNSIQGQIEAQKDDNADSNANNDIDDFITFNWATYVGGDQALELSMDPLAKSRGYTFTIKDVLPDSFLSSGTNFAGALGLNRFFDGDDATNIDLNSKLKSNPTVIAAVRSPSQGDNRVSLDMVQHQFEKFTFDVRNIGYQATTYGMFDIVATEVGTATNSAIIRNETIHTQYNATELEYSSISKVSIDEEMTNLIRYQTSYGAAAKVITTIDQMMQTLLGIKQ